MSLSEIAPFACLGYFYRGGPVKKEAPQLPEPAGRQVPFWAVTQRLRTRTVRGADRALLTEASGRAQRFSLGAFTKVKFVFFHLCIIYCSFLAFAVESLLHLKLPLGTYTASSTPTPICNTHSPRSRRITAINSKVDKKKKTKVAQSFDE